VLRKIKTTLVNEIEFKRNKERIKGNLMLDFEDSHNVASFFGEQEVLERKLETLAERMKRIDEVKKSDIIRVARDVVREKNLNLAIVGPHKNKKKILTWLKI